MLFSITRVCYTNCNRDFAKDSWTNSRLTWTKIRYLVFIDYKKAFESVDHSLFFGKLNAYGIRGKELSLFKDYFK